MYLRWIEYDIFQLSRKHYTSRLLQQLCAMIGLSPEVFISVIHDFITLTLFGENVVYIGLSVKDTVLMTACTHMLEETPTTTRNNQLGTIEPTINLLYSNDSRPSKQWSTVGNIGRWLFTRTDKEYTFTCLILISCCHFHAS